MITSDIDISLGLDVGKADHGACAVTKDGTKVWNRIVPNDEANITEVCEDLRTKGKILVVVDQPATLGAFAAGIHLGFSSLTQHRTA